jgi:hypothetical protein
MFLEVIPNEPCKEKEKSMRRTRMHVVFNAMSAWALALWAC